MIDQAVNSLNDIFALKGVRRGLWAVVLLLTISIVFEARTQYFSTQSVSARTDVLAKLSDGVGGSENDVVVQQLKKSLLYELKEINKKHENPASVLVDIVQRFLAGSWIVLFLIPLLTKFYGKLFQRMKGDLKSYKEYEWLAFFGLRGFSILIWLATLLGLISVVWNMSDNIFVSWIIFPVCSLMALFAVGFWAVLLRILLPYEKRSQ